MLKWIAQRGKKRKKLYLHTPIKMAISKRRKRRKRGRKGRERRGRKVLAGTWGN